MVIRCELGGGTPYKGEDVSVVVRALSEYDPKATQHAMDWRQKLDSQRGAVLANELRNNSNKLAKWTLCALLAGADQMKLGCVV